MGITKGEGAGGGTSPAARSAGVLKKQQKGAAGEQPPFPSDNLMPLLDAKIQAVVPTSGLFEDGEDGLH